MRMSMWWWCFSFILFECWWCLVGHYIVIILTKRIISWKFEIAQSLFAKVFQLAGTGPAIHIALHHRLYRHGDRPASTELPSPSSCLCRNTQHMAALVFVSQRGIISLLARSHESKMARRRQETSVSAVYLSPVYLRCTEETDVYLTRYYLTISKTSHCKR